MPQRIGRDQQHVKLKVADGTGAQDAIWWGAGDQPLPRGTFDLAFVPKINEYNGHRTVQLVVLDWRAA
jgi:single-stranded-DNA-specific exonuclease